MAAMRRGMDFDGDVGKVAGGRKPLPVDGGWPRIVGDERHDHTQMTGTETPQMQIRHPIAFDFETSANSFGQALIGHHVEEDGAGRSQEADGPASDDESADQTHDGIEPNPAEKPARNQRDDGQHGSERICEHVQISRADIAVVTVGVIVVKVVMVVRNPVIAVTVAAMAVE